jgi:hypothetical protein
LNRTLPGDRSGDLEETFQQNDGASFDIVNVPLALPRR